MRDGRIIVITGFLVIMALLGFSYYGKHAPAPLSPEKQIPVSSFAASDNKASDISNVTDESKAPVTSNVPGKNETSVTSNVSGENKAPVVPAATPENKTPASSAASTESQIPLSSAATIEQAKKNGESMWLLFRSTTCAPCVEMQKIFDQLQSDYKGKVRFISIDVDDRNNIGLVRTWKIQYIPTSFIIDSSGNVNYQNVGIIPVEDLKKELTKVVK